MCHLYTNIIPVVGNAQVMIKEITDTNINKPPRKYRYFKIQNIVLMIIAQIFRKNI